MAEAETSRLCAAEISARVTSGAEEERVRPLLDLGCSAPDADRELLDVVTTRHARTLRQAVWCNAKIKALRPHILNAV